MTDNAKYIYNQHVRLKVDIRECCIEMFNMFRTPIASRRPPVNLQTCQTAARHGHLDCLWIARANGWFWDERVTEAAAGNGHLNCLMYLHEKGCPWDEYTCSAAAAGGHLLCLKYAHEKQCPWNEETCSSAALFGNRECLVYAHENGCPWDSNMCYPCREVRQMNFI